MANGTNGNNGNDVIPVNDNPLSSWIGPGFAIGAGLVSLYLMLKLGNFALDQGNIWAVGADVGVLLMFVAAYYGKRFFEKFLAMFSGAMTGQTVTLMAPSKQPTKPIPMQPGTTEPQPAPQPGAQTGGQTPVPWQGLPTPTPPAPQPVVQPEIFDEAKFDAEIESAIHGAYSVVNPATKFYEAWQRGAVRQGDPPVARFSSQDPAWVAYLKKLVNKYFSFEWGLKDDASNLLETGALEYAIAHINDDKGCTTCGGKEMARCPWTSIHEKADYMGTPAGPYAMSLQNYQMVDLYARGMYFIA